MMLKVINLFAGPGAGKSTMAAGLFHVMKKRGYSVELITEYAKDKVWEESFETLDDQIYVFANQLHRQRVLQGKVEYAVTDSPLLLSLVYGGYSPALAKLRSLAMTVFAEFENTNVFIERTEEYTETGRMQTREEAERIDLRIFSMLRSTYVPFIRFEQYQADECAARLLEQLNLSTSLNNRTAVKGNTNE